jgi:hypothetical protein
MQSEKTAANRVILFGTAGILIGLTASGSALALSVSRMSAMLEESGIGEPDALSQAVGGAMVGISLGGALALCGVIALLIGIAMTVLGKE